MRNFEPLKLLFDHPSSTPFLQGQFRMTVKIPTSANHIFFFSTYLLTQFIQTDTFFRWNPSGPKNYYVWGRFRAYIVRT